MLGCSQSPHDVTTANLLKRKLVKNVVGLQKSDQELRVSYKPTAFRRWVVDIIGQWEDYKDSVEYSRDSDAMLLRHYEIRVDDVECLRLCNKSVRMCLQDNNKLRLTARFFASDDVVNFLPSFDTGKDHHIIVTQFADDGSWNYNVVDGIFGCKSARIVSVQEGDNTKDELVLEFVQV